MNRQVCGNHALLQCLAEGTLTADEAAEVKAHVAACPSCRSAVNDYKQIMWDLEHPPEIVLPAQLEDSYQVLMEAWAKERQSSTPAKTARSWLPLNRRPWKPAATWIVPSWALPTWAISSWSWPLSSRSLVSWTARSFSWTRKVPGVDAAQTLVRRTGSALIQRALPRRARPKGGGSD